ncbi:MAG: hypothetical protein DRH93_13960 [Deltaproteobacteria bacterium]|nr:MAG: hypothetical protein DRH93_13960 [Deltaproteobacteria bacterium]
MGKVLPKPDESHAQVFENLFYTQVLQIICIGHCIELLWQEYSGLFNQESSPLVIVFLITKPETNFS